MGSLPLDPYKALGVGKDADLSTIKTAYRKLVLKCHPDKVQDPALKAAKQDEFQRVQQAYEILGDDKKRKEYDEDAKLKRLRDELSRGMGRSAATPRSSPKNYNEPHIRTAEPPPSFKPGPPPTSPFSPYGSASHQFSHSWDRDIPFRTKVAYDEGHRARRTASYEKPRDEFKEERRRRKDDDEHEIHEWVREKERERERDREEDRERDRDRDRDRDRKSRSDREKDDRKDKIRREMEKREKERDRDRARRQEQQEKYRTRKPAYVEPNDDSDEDHRVSKKTSSTGIAATASAGGKRYADSARRDKSARRDESPRAELNADRTSEKMKYAADYMVNARRRGSKSGGPPDNVAYNLNFPDPDQTWHAGDSPRPRRPSQDDKKLRTRVMSDDGEVEDYKATPEFRPPRLSKSYTSPAGALHMSNSSAPRVPNLSRASTMDYARHPPPAAPAVPPPESSRHPSKSERRRRGSFDGYDDESRPRRSSAQPRVLHHAFDDTAPLPRTPKTPLYRASDDVHFHHSVPTTGSRKPGFSKVKVAPNFAPEHIYQAKRFSDEDIAYSNVHHSSNQYSSPHASYLHVRS